MVRKVSANWEERKQSCIDKRRKKTQKTKNICGVLARQGCIKSNGAVKKDKKCRRSYSGMIKWSTNKTVYRRNPKGDARTKR